MMIIIVTVIQIHIKYAFVGFPLYMVHTEASTINFRIACNCLVIKENDGHKFYMKSVTLSVLPNCL